MHVSHHITPFVTDNPVRTNEAKAARASAETDLVKQVSAKFGQNGQGFRRQPPGRGQGGASAPSETAKDLSAQLTAMELSSLESGGPPTADAQPVVATAKPPSLDDLLAQVAVPKDT